MKLNDHTLILNGQQPQDLLPEISASGGRPLLEGVELVIIRSSGPKEIHHTDHTNEHVFELSSHVLINRDGLVSQSIPFNQQVDTVVEGCWEGLKELRSRSVVITFENCGRLKKQGDIFVSECGQSFDATNVFTGIHRNEETLSYWQKFSHCQVEIAEKIIRSLTSTYQVKYILGNEEVCPGLKTDPGPAFPLEVLRRKVMRENRLHHGENESQVPLSEGFDLRTIIGKQQTDTADRKEARIVNIRRKNGGWYKVNIDLGGFIKEEWVSI